MQLFECAALGFRQIAQDVNQTDEGKYSIDQKRHGVAQLFELPRENELNAKADRRIDEAHERNGEAAELIRKELGKQYPHNRAQRHGEARHEAQDTDQNQDRVHIDRRTDQLRFVLLVFRLADGLGNSGSEFNIAFKLYTGERSEQRAFDFYG